MFALPPPPLLPAFAPVAPAALLLDFDGTLVEIAPTPAAVQVPAGLPGLLRALAARLDGALAIVSGRTLTDLDRFLPVPLPCAADHGATLRPDPAAPPCGPDLPSVPDAWRARAAAFVATRPGTLLEEKPHGFVLHVRGAPEAGPDAETWARALIATDLDRFALLPARMAWEIHPRGVSKGTAVTALMARPPFAGRVPVFIGDDVTDEAGMAAARRLGGHGLRLQTAFGSPAALRAWLAAALAAA